MSIVLTLALGPFVQNFRMALSSYLDGDVDLFAWIAQSVACFALIS